MLPDPTLPSSLLASLSALRPCFTAPSFTPFCALVDGMLAQTGQRTVCGMLAGVGLSRMWSHHRAHHFFSAAVWSTEQVGLALARLVVALLVGDGAPSPATAGVPSRIGHSCRTGLDAGDLRSRRAWCLPAGEV
jgi:SRSO17 transposase